MVDYFCKRCGKKVTELIAGKHDELISSGMCYVCKWNEDWKE